MPLQNIVDNEISWKDVIKDKHVLFDSSAYIQFESYNILGQLEIFKELNTVLCYIDPVKRELLNTTNNLGRNHRQITLMKNFWEIPLKEIDFKNTNRVQLFLSKFDCYPDITDLYLAGKLVTFGHDKIVLLTGNIKHFIYPLFDRKGYIILQNDKSSRILHILTIDVSVLS